MNTERYIYQPKNTLQIYIYILGISISARRHNKTSFIQHLAKSNSTMSIEQTGNKAATDKQEKTSAHGQLLCIEIKVNNYSSATSNSQLILDELHTDSFTTLYLDPRYRCPAEITSKKLSAPYTFQP